MHNLTTMNTKHAASKGVVCDAWRGEMNGSIWLMLSLAAGVADADDLMEWWNGAGGWYYVS